MTVEPTELLDPSGLERELLRSSATTCSTASRTTSTCWQSLPDAGLDSMATMQLLLLIEDRFGIWLPEEDLTRENFASHPLAGSP